MAEDLKSFKKDWQRWSMAERAAVIALAVVVTALLSSPVTLALL